MKRFGLVVASLLLSLVAPSALAGIQFPKATFAGVIGGDSPDQQGSFSVKTTATGAYTAKVKLGSRSASLSGQFDQNFHVDDTITYRPLPFVAIDIHLIMDLDPTGERIIGTVQTEAINNGNAIPFTLYQVFKYTTQNPAPQAGRFTGLFTKLDGSSLRALASPAPKSRRMAMSGWSECFRTIPKSALAETFRRAVFSRFSTCCTASMAHLPGLPSFTATRQAIPPSLLELTRKSRAFFG
jgi:hypothetical protein